MWYCARKDDIDFEKIKTFRSLYIHAIFYKIPFLMLKNRRFIRKNA